MHVTSIATTITSPDAINCLRISSLRDYRTIYEETVSTGKHPHGQMELSAIKVELLYFCALF